MTRRGRILAAAAVTLVNVSLAVQTAKSDSPSLVPYTVGHALAQPAWKYGYGAIDDVMCQTLAARRWRCHVSFSQHPTSSFLVTRPKPAVRGCRVFEDLSGHCFGLRIRPEGW